MKVSDQVIAHEFVEFIPDKLSPGKLYISIPYKTASHMCCCGCGQEVVTPISPTDWRVTFNGQSATLDPSIGNWSFDCRSHYLIVNDRIHWAEEWTPELIERGRERDRANKKKAFLQAQNASEGIVKSTTKPSNADGLIGWLKSLFKK